MNDELGTVAFINADGSGVEIAVGNELIGESNRPHPRDCGPSAEGAGLGARELPSFRKLVTNHTKITQIRCLWPLSG
jgi:hypothetical protein